MKIPFIISIILLGRILSAQTAPYDLDDLTGMALNRNSTLLRLQGEEEEALAAEKGARAQKQPLLTGLAGYSYVGIPQEGITVQAGDLGAIPGIGSLPAEDLVFMEDMKNNYYQLGVTLTQPLYTWGKLNLAAEAAHSQSSLKRETLTAQERKIRTEIETLLAALAVLDRTEEHLAVQEETVPRLIRIVEESYDKGFLLRTDVLEAQMLARETGVARRELSQHKDEAYRRLATLTGQKEIGREQLEYDYPGDLWENGTLPGDRERLWEGLLARNGELRQLAAGTEALRNLSILGEKQKAHLPDLGFQLDLKYASDILPFEEEEWYKGSFTATATLALTGSLFDGGRDRSSWEEARAREKTAQARYDETIAQLRETLESSCNDLELLEGKILYGDAKISRLEEEMKVKKNLWQAGAEGEQEYLKKLLEKEGAEIERLGLIQSYFQTLYTLRYLTGEER